MGALGTATPRATGVDGGQRRGPAAVMNGTGSAAGKAIYGARAQLY